MKRAGGDSVLGGSFAVVRTAAATDRKLYERLSSRICRASFLFFFTFSLARISVGAVSKLFLCLAVKDHTACVYIYRESEVSREDTVARLVLWNYAILRILEIREPFRWIVTSRGFSPFARRHMIFFHHLLLLLFTPRYSRSCLFKCVFLIN